MGSVAWRWPFSSTFFIHLTFLCFTQCHAEYTPSSIRISFTSFQTSHVQLRLVVLAASEARYPLEPSHPLAGHLGTRGQFSCTWYRTSSRTSVRSWNGPCVLQAQRPRHPGLHNVPVAGHASRTESPHLTTPFWPLGCSTFHDRNRRMIEFVNQLNQIHSL
jgi:hypothetical protein